MAVRRALCDDQGLCRARRVTARVLEEDETKRPKEETIVGKKKRSILEVPAKAQPVGAHGVVAEKPDKKPAAAKKKVPTKAHLSELEEAAELLTRIEEAEEECQEARLAVDDAREGYKLAKQNYAHRVDELRRLVRARKEEHPLFDMGAKQTAAQGTDSGAAASQPSANNTPPAAAVNGKAKAWRYLEVDALREADKRITEKHLKALRASKFETLGELADMMDRRETFWHQEVKGIGKDGKAPIEDALGIIRARADMPPAEKAQAADETPEDTDAAKKD
jgi:hypothetical protein